MSELIQWYTQRVMERVAKDVLVVAPENLCDGEFYDWCINGIMFACELNWWRLNVMKHRQKCEGGERECGGVCVWVLCCKFMLQYATYCHAYVFGACRWCGSYIWARDENFFPLDILLLLFFPNAFSYSSCMRSAQSRKEMVTSTLQIILFYFHLSLDFAIIIIYSCCFFLHAWFGGFFFSVCVCMDLFVYSKITTRSNHTLCMLQHMKNEL